MRYWRSLSFTISIDDDNAAVLMTASYFQHAKHVGDSSSRKCNKQSSTGSMIVSAARNIWARSNVASALDR